MAKRGEPPKTRGYVFVSRDDPNNEELWQRYKSLDDVPPEMLERLRKDYKKRFYGALGYQIIDTRKNKEAL